MTDLQRYIVEELAEEYRDGHLGRREFLRRIAVVAGSVAMAIPLVKSLGLAASEAEIAMAAAAPPPPSAAPVQGVTVAPDDPAIEARMVSFPFEAIQVFGYLAAPRGAGPFPGVIVVHENRGMSKHFKDVARRLAKAGYTGLAVDLLSPRGGTERFTDPAQVNAFLFQTPSENFVAILNAGLGYLRGVPPIRRDRIGAMGFCFGGGIVWRFATLNPDLRAAVPFYGQSPPAAEAVNIKAAVLAIYGELDSRLNAGIPAIRDAMQRANVTNEIIVYPGANHAFFNDTGERYNENAARQAWARMLAWFEKYLKGA